ncbi:DUF996 domain-containing protein [Thermococcus barossii]|uniref:DUF996 domain-containing protein n=1 Tax=Thermococcus barossii TaxID=54077 RepID=A0A2Z2MCY4_9EURY|nr:DUF996 domain-containing protein [Thermococcus barossii]ASJ04357.1 hypothetical protein A3L01_02885 [Thermococcus barossii]
MSELKNAKLLGGVGAILTLVGLGFVGFILKLFAVKDIAEATGRGEIFSKYLWAAILNIVAALILVASLWGVMFAMGSSESPEAIVGAMGIGGIIAAIIMFVGVWFMKQSYDMISEETGVGTFHTTALLYLAGAILIPIGLGLVILLVAAILEIVAFFSLPEELAKPDEGPVPVSLEE